MTWAKLHEWDKTDEDQWELDGVGTDGHEDLAAQIVREAVNVYQITWWECPAARQRQIHDMEYIGTLDEAMKVAYAQVRIG